MLPPVAASRPASTSYVGTAVKFKCAQRRLLTAVCRTPPMRNVAAPVENRFFRNYIDFETLVFVSCNRRDVAYIAFC